MRDAVEPLKDIERALRCASATIRDAVTYWWPAQGNADASERTYLLHVGMALYQCGCLPYAEVQIQGRPKEHIDLVAVNVEHGWILKVEAKQLYSAEKARELGKDWGRITASELPSQYRPLSADFGAYGCLLASCWASQNTAYIDWWRGDLRQSRPRNAQDTGAWAALFGALREADCRGVRGAFSVHRNDEAWLMYAVVPLPLNEPQRPA